MYLRAIVAPLYVRLIKSIHYSEYLSDTVTVTMLSIGGESLCVHRAKVAFEMSLAFRTQTRCAGGENRARDKSLVARFREATSKLEREVRENSPVTNRPRSTADESK